MEYVAAIKASLTRGQYILYFGPRDGGLKIIGDAYASVQEAETAAILAALAAGIERVELRRFGPQNQVVVTGYATSSGIVSHDAAITWDDEATWDRIEGRDRQLRRHNRLLDGE